MDPLLRGICEQYIDSMLKEDQIKKIKSLVKKLKLPVESTGDASLGFFLGSIYSRIDDHYLRMYNRLPKKEEMKDYQDILVRRSKEISEKFHEPSRSTKASKLSNSKKQKITRRVKVNSRNKKKPVNLEEKELEELRRSFAQGTQPPSSILGIPVKSV
jgi:hypothetical protein